MDSCGQAVKRSISHMMHLPNLDDRISLYVLTEERHAGQFGIYNDVVLDSVPSSFKPAKAMYKARALEWFRLSKAFTDQDWVIHLDEETVADTHCIQACLDLIEQYDAAFGQVRFVRVLRILIAPCMI